MSNTIYYNPLNGLLNDNPPATVVTGVPGQGKTYFLLNVAANCLLTNIRVIYIDFKNDSDVLINVDKDLHMIDVNNIEEGALNPFKVIDNIDTNTILDIIGCVVGKITPSQMNAISPIVSDHVTETKRTGKPTNFSKLSDYLYASPSKEAQEIGNALRTNKDSKYGPLLFSEKENAETFKFKSKSTVISLFGMAFPSATTSKEDLSQEERFTSAIVFIITRLLRDTLQNTEKRPTVLIIDEAHVAYMSKPIADVINSFLTLGRSLKVATVLASQNISHFPESISQFTSYKFSFRLSRQEAYSFMETFGITEKSEQFERESIIDSLMECEQGECFMLDAKNRGGFLKIKTNLGPKNINPLEHPPGEFNI